MWTDSVMMASAVQVVVISMLDPIGLSTLLVEFGIGTALKYPLRSK